MMWEVIQWLHDSITGVRMCWLLLCNLISELMEMRSLKVLNLTSMDLHLQTIGLKSGGLFLDRVAQIGERIYFWKCVILGL